MFHSVADNTRFIEAMVSPFLSRRLALALAANAPRRHSVHSSGQFGAAAYLRGAASSCFIAWAFLYAPA